MELLLIGIFTFFSFMVLKLKFEAKRYGDFTLDLVFLVTASMLFHGTITGLTIAMIATTMMSIYLYFFPPKFGQPKRKT